MENSATARQRDEQNKEYLSRNVNDILEPLMVEVVKHRPKDQVIHLMTQI